MGIAPLIASALTALAIALTGHALVWAMALVLTAALIYLGYATGRDKPLG